MPEAVLAGVAPRRHRVVGVWDDVYKGQARLADFREGDSRTFFAVITGEI